jgi:hypothetical protein
LKRHGEGFEKASWRHGGGFEMAWIRLVDVIENGGVGRLGHFGRLGRGVVGGEGMVKG